MDFEEYQKVAIKTAVFPRDFELVYPALGLGGEAGEVLELIKKMIRDDGEKLSNERRWKLFYELGDVLWYLSAVATGAELNLSEIAQANLDKLASRKRRGVITGSGDDR